MIVFALCALSFLVWAFIAGLLALALKRVPALVPPLVPASQDCIEKKKVSVVIPARNEEEDLADSLSSVLIQKGAELEVIVVNDHSSDRTGEIAENIAKSDSRIRVIHNPPLRPGWLGKCNAMQQGAAAASGEYLLFADADIIHTPGNIAAALSVMQERDYDLISLMPKFIINLFWESVMVPMYFMGIVLYLTPSLEDPNSCEAAASGAFILVKSSVFQSIGGFKQVKGEMYDDVSFARLVKRSGFRAGFRLAPEYLKVQLFKSNREAFWGTTKNVLMVGKGNPWLAVPAAILSFLIFGPPLYAVFAGVLAGMTDGKALLLALTGLAVYGLQYASLFLSRRLFQFSRAKALFFPLSAVVATCCISRALYLYLAKGIILWRGRKIKVRP